MSSSSQTRVSLEKVVCADGLELDGIVGCPGPAAVVVIHVHGKCGNFYQNPFISTMLELYPERGIAFVAFNSRGHDCLAEGYQNGQLTYVGGSLEGSHDDLLDMTAYEGFVTERWPEARVVYQGHSLGCDRLAYFARAGLTAAPLVLLSPADSLALQTEFIRPESVEHQVQRLRRSHGDEKATLLLRNEYGVGTGRDSYDIPVERKALLALLESRSLGTFGGGATRVSNPTLVYLGLKDPLVVPHLAEWQRRLEAQFEVSEWVVLDADHHFRGKERHVVSAIGDWIEGVGR